MNTKAIKSTLLAVIVTAVLCAGTLSARQLRSGPKTSATCGGSCSANGPGHSHGCTTNCFCILGSNGTGFCSGNPQLSQKPGK